MLRIEGRAASRPENDIQKMMSSEADCVLERSVNAACAMTASVNSLGRSAIGMKRRTVPVSRFPGSGAGGQAGAVLPLREVFQ